MPVLSSVVNYFATPFENTIAMTLSGSISPGATTVGVSGMSNYINGQIVVFAVDAGTPALKQVFTGTVSGSNVVNVVWTEGTNQPHSTGAAVVDYVSATTVGMISAGIQKQHTQTGTHTGITTDTLAASGNVSVGGTLTGAGFNTGTLQNPYKFSVYRNAALTPGIDTNIVFDTKDFDTGTNFSTSTGLFTAPIGGFYWFSASISLSGTPASFFLAALIKTGTVWKYGNSANSGAQANPQSSVSDIIQLTAGDTISVQSHAGTNLPLSTARPQTYFSGFLVSAT